MFAHVNNSKPLLLIMVCIYIFLVIERPWESIRYLHGFQIERFYAALLIIFALLLNKFKIVKSPTNKWVYGLLAIHFVFAPFAFNPSDAFEQGVEYGKMVVLYLLMLAVVDDEESIKILIVAYVFSTMFYVLHSSWEYLNGRHLWRMGISRMVGADVTFSDPNSFGATVVLSLPFVYALLRSEKKKILRLIYYMFFGLSIVCVILTGSRTSFVALLFLCIVYVMIQQGSRKVMIIIGMLAALTISWQFVPVEKKERFSTLWDSHVGPENARQSAEGRLEGWKASWRMFKQQPLTGVGAGGKNYIGYRIEHQIDDGAPSANQAHVLYGEVLAEFGIFGMAIFLGLIHSIWFSCRWTRSRLLKIGKINEFLPQLAGSIMTALFLLLIFGIGGHNFYRPLWLWLAAWSGSLYMIARKQLDLSRKSFQNGMR